MSQGNVNSCLAYVLFETLCWAAHQYTTLYVNTVTIPKSSLHTDPIHKMYLFHALTCW